MKNKNNLFVVMILLSVILCFGMVSAQQQQQQTPTKTQIKYDAQGNMSQTQMMQYQNMFQYRYNYTCPENCTYGDGTNNTMQLRMEKTSRFMFLKVLEKETYNINAEGKIVQAKFNIWSRLLNRNRMEVAE